MAYLEWERFYTKVAPTNARGCRLWTGTKAEFGHGVFYARRAKGLRLVGAHRWLWESVRGKVSRDACVMHKCDVPACVNLDHLMLGSRAENNRDRSAKGRDGSHEGEANGRAKLSADDVIALRTEYAAGQITQVGIAAKYGICENMAANIIKRRAWKSVL